MQNFHLSYNNVGGRTGYVLRITLNLDLQVDSNKETDQPSGKIINIYRLNKTIKYVLLLWTPSLNDRNKLKGQYTDVKSGSRISVGPSLKPNSLR